MPGKAVWLKKSKLEFRLYLSIFPGDKFWFGLTENPHWIPKGFSLCVCLTDSCTEMGLKKFLTDFHQKKLKKSDHFKWKS